MATGDPTTTAQPTPTSAPDLSALTQPGPAAQPVAPDINAPAPSSVDVQSGTPQPNPQTAAMGSMAQATADEAAAYKRAADLAKTPAVPPNAPHARLFNIIAAIGAGLSGAGTALATHGKEGGAEEVQQIMGARQQQQIEKTSAAQAQRNAQIDEQLRIGNTNHALAQNYLNLATLPDEMTKEHLTVEGARQDVIGKAQDIRTKALQDFMQTGDLAAYQNTLQQLDSTGGGASAAPAAFQGGLPAPDGTSAAAAPATAAGAAPAGGAAAPASGGAAATPAAGIPPVAVAAWKNSVDAASNAYPDDPAIKQAAAILVDPKSTPQQMAMAANGARNRMTSLDAGVKSRQEQETVDANSTVGKLSTPEALASPGAQAAITAKIADPTTSTTDRARLQLLLPQAAVAQQNAERIKQQEARNTQLISQGDPDQAGKLLADHTLTLDELKSRQVTPQFITSAVRAAQKYDPTFKAPEAAAQARIAAAPANQQFFGNTDSLLIHGGTLDQLVEAGNHISQHDFQILNKTKNWADLTTGNSGISAYAMKAIGVADDFAKVIGGGAGTDTARATIMGAIDPSLSPGQRAAAVDAARGVVTSQRNGRIGTNPYLKAMYPDPSTMAEVQGTAGTQPAPSGKSVSLAAARQLPAMKGMSDDQIKAAITAQGHQVTP